MGDTGVRIGDMGARTGDMGGGVGDRDSFPHSGFFDLDLFARRFLRRINARVVVTTEENLLRRNAVLCARNRCAAASV